MTFGLDELDRLVNGGWITRRKHPKEDLFILNYTPKTQYEGFWNDITLSCRGLIVDSSGSVHARCFRKFFNYEEVLEEVSERISSSMPFRIHEKVDGSLGILYWVGDEPFIATRGSFDSPQSRKANEILRSKPRPGLRRDMTYLFEIVYPENRICVDYGREEDLVLLAVMDTETGEEVFGLPSPFRSAPEVAEVSDFSVMKSLNIPNREGFVVRFEDSFRFKIKFEDYVRLHSLIFSISSKSVWRTVAEGGELPLDLLPDEVYGWVRSEEEKIRKGYESIVSRTSRIFSEIGHLERKEFARRALEYDCSSLLFAMLDGKPWERMVWKMVEPEYRTPFVEEVQKET